MNRKPCPVCKGKRVVSWRCDNCNTIVVDKRKCKCGRTRAKMLYNRMLVARLFEDTGDTGHNTAEIIRRYAYGFAHGRNIPTYLVEDAIANTFLRLVDKFDEFDRQQASFRTWAISILRNEILIAARNDATAGKHVAVQLDAQRDDDALTMESVLGYTYGVGDLIAAEEKERYVAMAALARKAFGSYSTVVGGEMVSLSVYDECIEAYEKRDGSGWRSMVARKTGISKQLIHRRQGIARRKWQEWNRVEGASEG